MPWSGRPLQPGEGEDFQLDVSITSAERKRAKRGKSPKNVRKGAKRTNARINKFLKSLGLYQSICVECNSETLRICHTSWQSCYLL